jgi:hypothetical protein
MKGDKVEGENVQALEASAAFDFSRIAFWSSRSRFTLPQLRQSTRRTFLGEEHDASRTAALAGG